jgi:hypothetical protein
MSLCDLLGEDKADPCATRLGCVEGNEQIFWVCQAWAVIEDRDHYFVGGSLPVDLDLG